MSPALGFAGGAIFTAVARATQPPAWLSLDVGADEGAEALAYARRMARLLRAKGLSPNRALRYHKAEGVAQREAAWAKRFVTAVAWLLSRREGADDPARAD